MNNIEAIVTDLKGQNMTDEQILQALEQMVAEGKMTPEEFELAKQELLNTTPEEEKKQAEELFGLKFI